jgi:hypothetical protein
MRRRLLADVMAGMSALMLCLALVGSHVAEPDAFLGNLVSGITFVAGFGAVGWLLCRRVPDNPIGWCFSAAAFVGGMSSLSHAWAALALDSARPPDDLLRVCALLDTFSWVAGVPLALLVPMLLQPDGRLLSRRWRAVLRVEVTGCVLGAIGFLTLPGPIDTGRYAQLDNPIGISGAQGLLGLFRTIGASTLTGGMLVGALAIVLRFRRSHGVERQQLRWVALGGCCAAVGAGFGSAAGVLLPDWAAAVAGVGFLAVPVCVGVAVLRYRLYDLGRIVSRTLSYALVTAMVVGIYLAVVTASAQLTAARSSFAVAASTLTAAAAFQPLRRRVQTSVDRRFNRARYDADRTVEEFRRQLRDEVDLAAVQADLLAVVQGTVQPAKVALWLRNS